MELKRIDVARQLWQMLRGILRDGGYVKSGSKMRNTANSFEDELYNPPKSEQGDSKNNVQHIKAEIAKYFSELNSMTHIDGILIADVMARLKQLSAVE